MSTAWDRFTVWQNNEPILTVRKCIWIVLGGWAMFIAYVLAGVGLALTLVFIPFVPSVFRFALFAFQPLTKEPYYEHIDTGERTAFRRNPFHPFTIIANIIWLVLFGWILALGHLLLAVIQALTIIGIGNAVQQVRIAWFALWPLGRSIRPKYLPRTLAELHGTAPPPISGQVAMAQTGGINGYLPATV